MNAAAPGKRPASELRAEVGRHWPQYRKAIFFSLIVNLLILAPTYFMLEVYDRVVKEHEARLLRFLAIGTPIASMKSTRRKRTSDSMAGQRLAVPSCGVSSARMPK